MPLGRRNSIATSEVVPLPEESHHRSATAAATSSSSTISSSTSANFSISYTSLKDIISVSGGGGGSAVNSPTAVCSEISIRNRLVKQAAWSYLQPMATSPGSAADHLLCRVIRSPLFSLLRAAARAVTEAFCFCFM